ncbi:cyclic nucleotide-binding domain-containing protein [Roseivirga sp.]|uniref:Crp/Fnr family transcriptional regulator n=1 Tax=Roseivirga sp. TaxID=1964215 RepID=UPI002B271B01|nr:cyclic nucleotide-binding domain-containing protein [Roseivirga sp.]
MYNPFKKTYSQSEKEQINFLKGVGPFRKLTDDQLFAFVPYLYTRKYRKNEAVFFTKDPSQAVYIVNHGIISLSLERNGSFEELDQAGKKECFGDNAFILDNHRLYSAIVSSEDAEIFVLPQGNIMDIFESYPEIKASVLECLIERYNHYTESLFKAYKESFGFFELKQAYSDHHNSERNRSL